MQGHVQPADEKERLVRLLNSVVLFSSGDGGDTGDKAANIGVRVSPVDLTAVGTTGDK